MKSIAIVKTAYGAPYMKRLCNHFSHKVPAVASGNQGSIEFPFGVCQIEVDEEQMRFSLEVAKVENMERAENVVERHLLQLANGDEPEVAWVRE